MIFPKNPGKYKKRVIRQLDGGRYDVSELEPGLGSASWRGRQPPCLQKRLRRILILTVHVVHNNLYLIVNEVRSKEIVVFTVLITGVLFGIGRAAASRIRADEGPNDSIDYARLLQGGVENRSLSNIIGQPLYFGGSFVPLKEQLMPLVQQGSPFYDVAQYALGMISTFSSNATDRYNYTF